MLVDLDHDPPARRIRIPALGIVRAHLEKLPDRSLGSPAILQRHRLAHDDVTLLFPKRSIFRTQHRHLSFLQRVILARPVEAATHHRPRYPSIEEEAMRTRSI